MRIAIDAMGGDHAPAAVVDGAVAAARELGLSVLLVGDRTRLDGELRRHRLQGLDLETLHASESIGMDEAATAALRKPDSSMHLGLRAVREGAASGFVYAGNTGAGMVLGMHVLGRSEGVDRPAIAVQVPTVSGQTILLDAGANVDCRALHLVQFAMMGEAYARALRRVASPRIGLLSNGVEDGKGSAAVREAAPLLRRLPINFVGYVEGRDVSSGKVDVVVCDGFVGNAVLKGLEGFAGLVGERLRGLFRQSLRTRIAGFLARSALRSLAHELDPRETGGALLLGLNGTVVKAHGSSDAHAIRNALALAADLSRSDVSREVARGLAATLDLAVQAEPAPGRARRLWSSIRGRLTRDGRAATREAPPAPVSVARIEAATEAKTDATTGTTYAPTGKTYAPTGKTDAATGKTDAATGKTDATTEANTDATTEANTDPRTDAKPAPDTVPLDGRAAAPVAAPGARNPGEVREAPAATSASRSTSTDGAVAAPRRPGEEGSSA